MGSLPRPRGSVDESSLPSQNPMVLLQVALSLLPAAPEPVIPSGRVLMVDYTGVQGYPSAQHAVDDAESGDTIVLLQSIEGRFEVHPGFTIRGKSLTVVGKSMSTYYPKARVEFIEVLDVPLGEVVVLRDIASTGRQDTTGGQPRVPGLRVSDSEGAVRLSSCVLGELAVESWLGPWEPAVSLDSSLDVSLHECRVEGSGAGGLVMSQSRVAIYGSALIGGAGLPAWSYTLAEAGDGSPALQLANRSFAWLGATTITGGRGGYAECIHGSSCAALTGDGGAGAVIEAGSLCVALEAPFAGGAPGEYYSTPGPGSSIGVPGIPYIGEVSQVPGEQRLLHGPSSTRSGQAMGIVLTGTPGEEVILQVAQKGGHRYLGPLLGVLLVNDGFVGAPEVVGVVPASGRLELDYELPPVAASVAATVSLQAIFRSSPTRFRLSPPLEVSILGQGTPILLQPERLYVNGAAAPGGDGLSWATAINNLSDALGVLPAREDSAAEVWVAEGTYLCAPSHSPGAVAKIEFEGPLRLLGGFAGDETEADQRDPVAHPVIISGDLAGNDDLTGGPGPGNSNGLLQVSNYGVPVGPYGPAAVESFVSGITWQGSYGSQALRVGGASVIDGCTFRDNFASSGVAGLYVHTIGGPPQRSEVRSCVFVGNAGDLFGAVRAHSSNAQNGPLPPGASRFAFSGCSFVGNLARNTHSVPGGGHIAGASAIGVTGDPDPIAISSCTFVDNGYTALPSGLPMPLGGVYVDRDFHVTFTNNACWSADLSAGSNPGFSAMDTTDGDVAEFNRVDWLPADWSALTNTTSVPLFVDVIGPDGLAGTGDEDVRLGPGSPCIDAGNSNLVPAGMLLDLDGNTRFVNDPNAPDVGVGGTRIVDMGAYERQ